MPRPAVLRLHALVAGVGTALLLLGIAGCAGRSAVPVDPHPTVPAAGPSAPAVVATQLRTFVPSGTPTRTISGTCWTNSITVSSRDAYRCFAGTEILDPCFATSGAAVDCYAAPWSAPVRIRLAAPLPAPTPPLLTHPWALELAGGVRCLAGTGVAPRVAGVALVYRCEDGGATGTPTRRADQWQVERVAAHARAARPTAVTVMWST